MLLGQIQTAFNDRRRPFTADFERYENLKTFFLLFDAFCGSQRHCVQLSVDHIHRTSILMTVARVNFGAPVVLIPAAFFE
jgi:hypothetical protein